MMLALLGLALAASPASPGAEGRSAPSATPPPAAPAVERVTGAIVVQVDDLAAAQRTVIADAESFGGWFSSLSDSEITLRIPTERVAEMTARARALGDVVDRSLSREELGPALADAEAALAARRTVLARYFEVLAGAGPDSVVSVEREIDRVIREVEGLEGRLRVLRDQARHARLVVSFRFRDRAAPAPDGESSFAWINAVSLAGLLGDFRDGSTDGTVCGVDVAVPEGFAPFRGRRLAAAVSPDDVVWRIRTLPNRPEADLAFWSEALRAHLTAAGYRPVGEPLEAVARDARGSLTEWTAPDGEKDARWIVALFVDGGSIHVVEAAGEAGRFPARRQAILDALRATGL
ncbi:MAG: hypothetical protein RLZZ299_1192 [Pseudomonadota bacterium]|jgi:hypothetical protein